MGISFFRDTPTTKEKKVISKTHEWIFRSKNLYGQKNKEALGVIPELIFLLDKSGSMSGSAWKAVQNCISIFLRSLPKECYFNIVLYDHSYTKIFPQSVKYTKKTMKVCFVLFLFGKIFHSNWKNVFVIALSQFFVPKKQKMCQKWLFFSESR